MADFVGDVDVVVVGAGFSGLAAATALTAVGLEVLVLEASERVGGRTLTVERDGLTLELGGQWTGPAQRRLLALAAEFDVATFPTPGDGSELVVSDGIIGQDDQLHAGIAALVEQLDALALEVPAVAPWEAPKAAEWDAVTVRDWLAAEVSDLRLRHAADAMLSGLMTVPSDEMSLLTLLDGAVTSGSLGEALGMEGGAQESRFAGGVQQLAERLADGLGDRVRLEAPVDHVAWTGDGVTVSAAGSVVRARRLVVAIPPSQIARVVFDPPLPAPLRRAHDLMPLGAVIKVQAVYERPFWREDGLSGGVFDLDGPLEWACDNSSPDSERGVLVSFFSGQTAREFSDAALGATAAAQRRAVWVDAATGWFGPKAADLVDYVDHDWASEEWIGGGYSGVMRPGGWLAGGSQLHVPVGAVHWAGSETATEWTGYIEGALQAGERAAAEVRTALG